MTLKKLTTTASCLLFTMFLNAQNNNNQIANNNKSTVEHANEIIMKNMEFTPSAELYDDWNNKFNKT